MVLSLRSLCLLKVASLKLAVDEKSLPAALVEEVKKIQLFNGTFIEYYYYNGNPGLMQFFGLTLKFDGVEWMFKSCSAIIPNICCPNCSLVSLPEVLAHEKS